MIVSKSHKIHSPSPPLTIGRSLLKVSERHDIYLYWEWHSIPRSFEKHLCSVSKTVSERLGIFRKSCRVFHDRLLLGRCCHGFILHVLEYCSAVWCSAADTHLNLLDRVVCFASFLTVGVFENWRKNNSWNQPMVDCTLESIQHSSAKQSLGKVIPHSYLSRQDRSSKLERSTPCTLTSNGWAVARAQITSWEMLSGFCPSSIGALFCSLVLCCRYTP